MSVGQVQIQQDEVGLEAGDSSGRVIDAGASGTWKSSTQRTVHGLRNMESSPRFTLVLSLGDPWGTMSARKDLAQVFHGVTLSSRELYSVWAVIGRWNH